ncbi:GNAT family N-acetyltransferase [Shewanella sp. 202IG2-18]|uniref:GNAT family N-acetyltransferase n=1 Tax=Parashewanella hymeniacidonis TaxID=2807618 RepID=UPI0019605318|nr:GNAT family N-acetyltransferase [Parashewanella hymeniacidonis]MBM7074456.1 GNAT family N-acetyltransferase [Parashewanella hymeniacidonis]
MTKLITETPRFIIREFNLNDAADVLAFNGNKQVIRYTGDPDTVRTIDDANQIITDYWLKGYQENGYARWAVEDKQTKRVIGFCGFKYEDHESVQANDVGYRFLPEYWGKGVATETLRACLVYAKHHLDFDEIIGDVMVENPASSRVLEKAGFEFKKRVNYDGETLNRYILKLSSWTE